MNSFKQIRPLLIIAVFALVLILITLGFNSSLKVTEYTISSEKLPDKFNGFKICQITDFHCKEFGNNEEILINAIAKGNPDIIVITGDLVDSSHTLDNARILLDGISDIAPVYAVSGNHEFDTNTLYKQVMELYEEYNVIFLDDDMVSISIDQDTINLYGLMYRDRDVVSNTITPDSEDFNILLYHDPSFYLYFQYMHYNLVITGHAHGGIIRLPLLGGVLGTSGNLFPEYDKGLFTSEADSCMVVSSGLGDSFIPRFNNPPEIVMITLTK